MVEKDGTVETVPSNTQQQTKKQGDDNGNKRMQKCKTRALTSNKNTY